MGIAIDLQFLKFVPYELSIVDKNHPLEIIAICFVICLADWCLIKCYTQ